MWEMEEFGLEVGLIRPLLKMSSGCGFEDRLKGGKGRLGRPWRGQVLEFTQVRADAAWTAGSSGCVVKREQWDLLIDGMCEKGKSRADSRCRARIAGRMELPVRPMAEMSEEQAWAGRA